MQAELPARYQRVIIAINDGSTDDSQEVLEYAARAYPVEILRTQERRGLPASFSTMFTYLENRLEDDDLVFTLEADGTNDITCVPAMEKAVHAGADVVIASRYAPGATSIGFPRYRLIGSHVINFFLQMIWDVPQVKDYSVLYRVYRGSLLRRYSVQLPTFVARKSFAVIAEILFQLTQYTSKFAEVPLRYDYRLKKGKSKMKLLQTLWEYVRITLYQSPIHRQPIFWVALGAFSTSLLGITYGLPDLIMPDEPSLTRGALTMLKLHTLIPALHPAEFTTMYYPPLTAYLYMPVLAVVVGISYLLSGAASVSAYTTQLILDPTIPWMATRAVSAFIGALAVYFIGRLAERIYPGSGIFAALFLATSFLQVTFSHTPRHWVLSTLLIIGMIWAAYRILTSGEKRWYVFGGLFAGLGAGTGLVTLLLGIVPGLAHLFRSGSITKKFLDRKLWLMIAVALGFLVLFALLHPAVILGHFFGNDWQDNTFREPKSVLGLLDMSVVWARDLLQIETALFIFTLIGLPLFWQRHKQFAIILCTSCFVVLLAIYFGYYYIFHFMQLILPILVILAAVAAREVVVLARTRFTKILIAFLIFALPVSVALRTSYLWTQPDTRHQARAYIEEHLEWDARIISHAPNLKIVWPTPPAIEERIAFNPDSLRLVDQTLLALPSKEYPTPAFSVFEVGTLSQEGYDNLTEEFLVSKNFDYLVIDRFASKYPGLEALIAEGELVASFPEEGPAIDVMANEYDGPSTDVFRIRQLGPRVDIIKLSQ